MNIHKRRHLRILSYNIHKGFSSGNRKFVLTKMRDAIRLAHADLVFLQEVLGEHKMHQQKYEGWPSDPQFEYLAEEIWPHTAYGMNAVYNAGHHGNAILSKFPIGVWENLDISTNRLERRGLLHAVVEIPREENGTSHGGEHSFHLHAICIHLGLLESERAIQAERLCERIASHVPAGHPLLIAGDFNDWRGKITRVLEEKLGVEEAFQHTHGHHARSFPSWFPVMRLDRIYCRGLEIKEASVLTVKPWSDLSDHAALYVETTLG